MSYDPKNISFNLVLKNKLWNIDKQLEVTLKLASFKADKYYQHSLDNTK